MNREQLLGHICNRLSNISESVVILTELLEKFIDTPETVKEIQPESSILSTPALSIKKEKKVKDPNAPKAPLTSYLLFSNEKRTQLTTDNPEAKFAELAKLMGNLISYLHLTLTYLHYLYLNLIIHDDRSIMASTSKRTKKGI